jgi:hypothetical protein
MTRTLDSGRYQLVLDGLHSKRYLDEPLPVITLPIKPKIKGVAGGLSISGPLEGTRYRLVATVGDELHYESERA